MLHPISASLHDFDADQFGRPAEVLQSAAETEDSIVIICCSDLAAAPYEIAHVNYGTHVLQNLGNTVSSVHSEASSTLASLWFALINSRIRHLILCGHTPCRVLQHAVSGIPSTVLSQTLEEFNPLRGFLNRSYATLRGQALHEVAVQENVLAQLENLLTHKFIRKRLNSRRLQLHGWVVEDSSAQVSYFDPGSGQFMRQTACQDRNSV